MGKALPQIFCDIFIVITLVSIQLSHGISSDFGQIFRNLFCSDDESIDQKSVQEEAVKIFDGSIASSSYPFMVAIVLTNEDEPPQLVCGASLVDEAHILTAAHCSKAMQDSIDNGDGLEAWIGVKSFKNFDGLKIPIQRVKGHPAFKPRPILHNDIAIAELKWPVNITDNNNDTKPVCIGTGDYDGVNVTLIGFGNYDCFNDSRELRIASGQAMSNTVCQTHGHKKRIQKFQVCAELENPEHRRAEQAPGDSGGPLFFQMDDDTFAQVGSVSYNYIRNGTKDSEGNYRDPCPNLEIPGVYTRVGAYKEFIQSHAPNAKFCE